MTTAAYHREYRRLHAETIRERERLRRQQPVRRAQRHASEQRRRARLRASVPVPTQHPLLDAAARLVPMPHPGRLLRWRDELTAEDARSEAVLAILEQRDPMAAVKAFRTAERSFALHHRPWLMEAA